MGKKEDKKSNFKDYFEKIIRKNKCKKISDLFYDVPERYNKDELVNHYIIRKIDDVNGMTYDESSDFYDIMNRNLWRLINFNPVEFIDAIERVIGITESYAVRNQILHDYYYNKGDLDDIIIKANYNLINYEKKSLINSIDNDKLKEIIEPLSLRYARLINEKYKDKLDKIPDNILNITRNNNMLEEVYLSLLNADKKTNRFLVKKYPKIKLNNKFISVINNYVNYKKQISKKVFNRVYNLFEGIAEIDHVLNIFDEKVDIESLKLPYKKVFYVNNKFLNKMLKEVPPNPYLNNAITEYINIDNHSLYYKQKELIPIIDNISKYDVKKLKKLTKEYKTHLKNYVDSFVEKMFFDSCKNLNDLFKSSSSYL